VRQRAFIVGLLMALAAMPEPARAQSRDLPGAVLDVVTTPFRILRGRSRPPDFVRPPADITPPLYRTTRPALTKKARQARKTVLRRRKAAIVRAARRAPPAATIAAPAAAAALPRVGARPQVPDDLVPAIGTPRPDQSPRSPRTPAAGAPQPDQGRGAARPPVVASWDGPLHWPYAADDLLDYAFLPSGSSDRFWAHGVGDLFQAMFAPTSGRANWIEMCGSRQGGAGAWIGPIEQAVKPTEAQRAALDEVRKALVTANNAIKTTCPGAETLTNPAQRLNAMGDRLWAMRQAVVLVRIPFVALYDSLSGNQKARLTDESARTDGRADDAPVQPSGAARLCGTVAGAQWPAEHIEQRVRPSDEQRRGLETLRMTMLGMTQLLMASCPQDATATPLARLDAAEKRLNAMLYAVRIVGPVFNGFYASLSDEQKAGLTQIARNPNTARDAIGTASPGSGER
jgi:hypothetical protein